MEESSVAHGVGEMAAAAGGVVRLSESGDAELSDLEVALESGGESESGVFGQRRSI